MRVPIFHLDAFAARRFSGNPAAIMPLPTFLDNDVLQAIAAENSLPATAFLVAGGNEYRLRWFTPVMELQLCGHATLASAAVVMERLETSRRQVTFHTASGPLTVRRSNCGYVMDLPARRPETVCSPCGLTDALNCTPLEVSVTEFSYIALLDSAQAVRNLLPAFDTISRLDRAGVIVTGPGDGGYDFVSRYFAPARGIPEDSVTGTAHCTLVPYWELRLGKSQFRAYQASRRGGEIICRAAGDRVELEGSCAFYLEGSAEV
jgi:PhzF family phenazine biosynthesis protein